MAVDKHLKTRSSPNEPKKSQLSRAVVTKEIEYDLEFEYTEDDNNIIQKILDTLERRKLSKNDSSQFDCEG